MATIAIAGCDGSVTGQDGGAEITSWTASLKVTALEATSMESNCFEEFIEGLKGGEGSFDAIGSDIVTGLTTGNLVLRAAQAIGSRFISGPAIIEVGDYDVTVDGKVEYSASFKFTGAFTRGLVT